MRAPRDPAPDLLRRFTDTRHHLTATGLKVETNDRDLLLALEDPRILGRIAKLAPDYRFKLLRDYDVGARGEAVMVIHAGAVSTMTVGVTTIIMVDRDRREVLSFIAGIAAIDYFDTYLPLALEKAQSGHFVSTAPRT